MTDTVCVVDDDRMVLESLSWLLGTIRLESRIYESSASFLREYSPGIFACVILDVRMPEMNGMELHQKIREKDAKVPVIIVTGHADVPMAVRAMKAGAFDFIEKPYSDQLMLERVQAAIRSFHEQHDDQLDEAVQRSFDTLTPRERQILEQVLNDRPNKRIAAELGISKKTVEFHRANLMEKLGVKTVAELVRLAIRAGMDPEF